MAAGSFTPTAYYLTNDGNASGVDAEFTLFSGPNCTGTAMDGHLGSAPQTDGMRHLVGTGTITYPSGGQSIAFGVVVDAGDETGTVVNFDDIDFETMPLAVTLTSFRAARARGVVVLHWRTGTEVETLGFNVYRQRGGKHVRLNRRLLPAPGAVAGSSYSFLDRRAPKHPALHYWLQDVSTSGVRTWHGPLGVAAS